MLYLFRKGKNVWEQDLKNSENTVFHSAANLLDPFF